MSYTIGIVDYGIGNVKSIENAIIKLNAVPFLSNNHKEILQCDKIILPGVGAFKNGMQRLLEKGLDKTVRSFVDSGKPLLGICLGMQLLFEYSEEFGHTKGLGIINGGVKKIPTDRRLPHIGWNTLAPTKQTWEDTILANFERTDKVYFVHTFAAFPEHETNYLAKAVYQGIPFCAATIRENVVGTQFHPEKSGEAGLSILNKFITL